MYNISSSFWVWTALWLFFTSATFCLQQTMAKDGAEALVHFYSRLHCAITTTGNSTLIHLLFFGSLSFPWVVEACSHIHWEIDSLPMKHMLIQKQPQFFHMQVFVPASNDKPDNHTVEYGTEIQTNIKTPHRKEGPWRELYLYEPTYVKQ